MTETELPDRGGEAGDHHDERESPLPRDWLKQLNAFADLDRSFEELAGRQHFYAEAMRGFIRSLQLRFVEAWEHFDKAYESALFAEETIPNLVRQFQMNIHTFENAVLESPVMSTEAQLPELWIPDMPESILVEYPEVRLVIFLRRLSEAHLRLHLGESERAGRLYGDLCDDRDRAVAPHHVAVPYLGLAASELNLGNERHPRIVLERASSIVRKAAGVLQPARDAATLSALYDHVGDTEKASSWRRFIEHLDCPWATRDAFLQRADVVRSRCEHHARAVVI